MVKILCQDRSLAALVLPCRRLIFCFVTSWAEGAPIGVSTLGLFLCATIQLLLPVVLSSFSLYAFLCNVAVIQCSWACLVLVALRYTWKVLYAVLCYALYTLPQFIYLAPLSLGHSFISYVSVYYLYLSSLPHALWVWPYCQHLKHCCTQTTWQYSQALYQRLSITTLLYTISACIFWVSRLIIRVLHVLTLWNPSNTPMCIVHTLQSYATLDIIIPKTNFLVTSVIL